MKKNYFLVFIFIFTLMLRLIGNQANTYTFTKALAENVLVKEANTLPITIVRPSIGK